MGGSDALELMEAVPAATAEQRAWGSVVLDPPPAGSEPLLLQQLPPPTGAAAGGASAGVGAGGGYGACEKMASTGGFFAPWLGAFRQTRHLISGCH